MTTVPPPTTPSLPVPPPAQTAPVVLILAPPPAVAALPAGAPLEGVVIPSPPTVSAPAADARTDVTIRTPAGDLTLRLPAPLPPESAVELQVVRAAADQATLRLVTVDNQPAAQVLAQLRQSLAASTPPAQAPPQPGPPQGMVLPPANAWTPQGPIALPALGTISAYVIQGALLPEAIATPGAMPAPAAPAFTLATGGELAVRVTAVQLPSVDAPIPSLPAAAPSPLSAPALGPSPAATPAPVIPGTPGPLAPLTAPATPAGGLPSTPQTPAASLAAPSATASAPALLVAGPEGLPPRPPAPPAVVQGEPPQAVLTGVVVRAGPTSPPVIATELGEIQLNVRANLPLGARVTVAVGLQLPPQPGAAPPPLPVAALPLSGPPSGGTTVGWPSLSEALGQLQRADPAAAAEFAEVIPDGGPRTTTAVIAFAQAMRIGDTRAWPGEGNLRAVERLGPRGAHLARQIGDEVAALSGRANDAGGSEWRALPVPWNADGRIDRITLITRREGEAEDTAAGKKGRNGGTRFLVTLDLSRLGPLQVDGMFRKDTRGLEVMIRTQRPLPDSLRLELTGVFGASTAAMGLKGGLGFQVVRKFPDPLGDGRGSSDKSGLWA